MGNAASTIVISYDIGECNLYAKILFCFIQLSAGHPGGLVVLPSNTTNVCLSLSSIPTMIQYCFICKNAKHEGDQLLRAPSSMGRYDSTRCGKKMLTSRDKNEGVIIP